MYLGTKVCQEPSKEPGFSVHLPVWGNLSSLLWYLVFFWHHIHKSWSPRVLTLISYSTLSSWLLHKKRRVIRYLLPSECCVSSATQELPCSFTRESDNGRPGVYVYCRQYFSFHCYNPGVNGSVEHSTVKHRPGSVPARTDYAQRIRWADDSGNWVFNKEDNKVITDRSIERESQSLDAWLMLA